MRFSLPCFTGEKEKRRADERMAAVSMASLSAYDDRAVYCFLALDARKFFCYEYLAVRPLRLRLLKLSRVAAMAAVKKI